MITEYNKYTKIPREIYFVCDSSDFDELLDKSEFRNVEKIKTIGATFMAASGLNPFIRGENQHKYQHLQVCTS